MKVVARIFKVASQTFYFPSTVSTAFMSFLLAFSCIFGLRLRNLSRTTNETQLWHKMLIGTRNSRFLSTLGFHQLNGLMKNQMFLNHRFYGAPTEDVGVACQNSGYRLIMEANDGNLQIHSGKLEQAER